MTSPWKRGLSSYAVTTEEIAQPVPNAPFRMSHSTRENARQIADRSQCSSSTPTFVSEIMLSLSSRLTVGWKDPTGHDLTPCRRRLERRDGTESDAQNRVGRTS